MLRFLLLCFLAVPAHGQTVYKTVEDGVPTFSDAPPEDGRSTQVLEIDAPPPSDDGLLEERLNAMRETTDRMADDRREREQYRAQVREEQRDSSPVPASDLVPAWGGTYWPSYQEPVRPRPPFRPGHPEPRSLPTPPPGWSVIQPGNSQLMRPIVSGKR